MKYPFSPEILDAMPEELAELFRALEAQLLEEICSRLKIAGELNEVTVESIKALRSHGIDLEEIEKAISEATGISREKLDKLLDDVVERNQRYFTDIIDKAKVTQPETLLDAEFIANIKAQTQDELTNITRSMGFLLKKGGKTVMLEPAKAYQWALDNAVVEINAGATSYNEAIKRAVTQLADSGIKTVSYESGHVDHVDVAVRRAVMTGISQLSAKYVENSAEWLETPYYEVSAHSGARDKGVGPMNHKSWQGKVYSVRDGDIYPSIYEVCGLDTGPGLEGWNCRHRRYPFVEGVMERTYTDEQLRNIDPPPFEYQGKTYTAYEATQKQREIERTVRKLKRREEAYKAAGLDDDARNVAARRRRLSKEYTDFSKAAGLPEQRERMKVRFVDDKSIQEAAAKRQKRVAKEWKVPTESVTIDQNGVVRVKVTNAQLSNGLPITGTPNAIVDKTDELGAVMQRRVYRADGKAAVDYDTTDHGASKGHPTGAHKHVFNYRKKNPHGPPLPLSEQELNENKDIITRGENYSDQTGMDKAH